MQCVSATFIVAYCRVRSCLKIMLWMMSSRLHLSSSRDSLVSAVARIGHVRCTDICIFGCITCFPCLEQIAEIVNIKSKCMDGTIMELISVA